MAEALYEAIVAADSVGAVAALLGLAEAPRRALAPLIARAARADPHEFVIAGDTLAWTPRTERDGAGRPWYRQLAALKLAAVGTLTIREMRPLGWTLPRINARLGAEVLLDRRPPWLQEWADWMLGLDLRSWYVVRQLVWAGAVERPPDYLGGLVFTGRPADRFRGHFTADRGPAAMLVQSDPDLLAKDVWDAFARDDGTDSLRAADDAGARWREVALALDRGRLLDTLLRALGSDLPAYRAAWHLRVWKELKVTRPERATRVAPLRELLGAAAPNIVAFAVDELVRTDVVLAASELAPGLAAPAKKTVRGALKLLDRAPDADAALIALGHEAADIQGEVLDRLERWGVDGARLLGHVDLLAATVRPRADALLGIAATGRDAPESVDASHIPASIREALNFGGRVPEAPVPAEPVLGEPASPPIASLDELADALATELAGDWRERRDERLLDGILRFCGEPFPAHLADRTPHHGPEGRCETVLGVAGAWMTGVPPMPARSRRTWFRRLETAARRAAERRSAPLLALPTHVGGWIDPDVLAARLYENPDPVELEQARLRLPTATGEPDPEGVLADHVDAASHDDRLTWFYAQIDPSGFPARRDIACAGAIHRLGNWRTYEPTASEVLEVLLTQPLPPLALRLAVLTLCSSDQREQLLATDLLIAGIADGRIDAPALIEATDVSLVLANRLAGRLAIVARSGPLHAAVARDLLDGVAHALGPRPLPVLALLDELCAQTGAGVRDQRTRAYLATLAGASKTAKTAKALLARDGDPDDGPLLLAARVRRAERWLAYANMPEPTQSPGPREPGGT